MKTDYEYIDNLVFQYQQGSDKAGLEIIQLFGYCPQTKELSNYLHKYFSLLRYGVINFRDRDTRQFIRLFTSDPVHNKALIPHYQYADTKKAARKTVQMINDRLSHISDNELTHDLCILLLEQAKRFKKKSEKINFCGYLYNSYRYRVHDYYAPYFRDLSYSDRIEPLEDYIDEQSEITIKDSWYHDLYFENEEASLGFNWILGRTATYPFDQLTTFERTLLSLYDDKKHTYEEVGNIMGYHRDTIWQKRKQIKAKLEELMKRPPE